jgi:rod shape-determining protein MreD
MKKALATIIFSYFLVLFQNNFMAHFSLAGWPINLALILLLLFNIAEALGSERFSKIGLVFAFSAGFFLDVFSSSFLGRNVLIFLAIFIFFNLIVKRHVRVFISKR